MVVTISMLLFGLMCLLVLACLAVLLAVSPERRARLWYAVFIISFMPWAWLLYSRPAADGLGWLYLMPLIWISTTLWFIMVSPASRNFIQPAGGTGEPGMLTQERLRGIGGSREALRYYFGLLLIALIVIMTFMFSAAAFSVSDPY